MATMELTLTLTLYRFALMTLTRRSRTNVAPVVYRYTKHTQISTSDRTHARERHPRMLLQEERA